MNNRVRFFSPEDMSSYYNLQKATQVIESISEDKVYSDINDVIELYHIRQFVRKLLQWHFSRQDSGCLHRSCF